MPFRFQNSVQIVGNAPTSDGNGFIMCFSGLLFLVCCCRVVVCRSGISERLKALFSTTCIFKVPGKREGVSFFCVEVSGLQIGVAATVHRFSADLCCFRIEFFAFQSAVVICCARLLFLNCGLVWLAAVLDGGGRVLLRVLYMSRAMRGALFDAWLRAFL